MTQHCPAFARMHSDRDRDRFVRELLHELTGLLEETVGLEEAEGFIALVGNRIGNAMNAEYRAAAGTPQLSRDQVAEALVDLKRRIRGGFAIDSIDPDRIVLTNTACPFGRYVAGRRSLCMMTSNVFGRIAAANLGYARVTLDQTIAEGHDGCRVVVHFNEGEDGRAYFG
ncbi:methanogen output domain 1-containing protein [Pseudoponticoccus marisrubri]|uniref:Transcriptional regulator n=1 Tax=Pseudoponticoccus marisrubri TaxID=1685382 RepID=A0A0W7WNQ0_9RHOB|nr:methanogen output domain 1-containing protein [Pseudoponticoccus marisrubri]KUF12221.1 transcriptional regulator [Pseudoponticoccus marisrubri]